VQAFFSKNFRGTKRAQNPKELRGAGAGF